MLVSRSDNEDFLKDHLQESHGLSEFEAFTDEEVRTPKTNSQGKIKTFKCKQCGYFAVTKLEFWEHTKTHIRNEKMLTCPKCPFVTEYKHHLEYHLRNHFGSKPFQCNKCAYSCVNKSMLNSHLKSHSNIYQYRCSDCSYATKYCHSLKLHLRKYDHKPSMVLNPDGTPNPLPIIDVYGTRRGPKIKRTDNSAQELSSESSSSPGEKEKSPKKSSKRSHESQSSNIHQNQCRTPHTSPAASQEILPYENGHHLFSPPQLRFQENTNRHEDDRDRRSTIFLHQGQISMQTPHSSLSPGALQGFLMQNSANNMGLLVKNPMEVYAAALNQYILSNSNPLMHLTSSPLEIAKIAEGHRANLLSQILNQQQTAVTSTTVSNVQTEMPNKQRTSPVPVQNSQAPLDLRNPRNGEDNRCEEGSKKRKRKGKALRYERVKELKVEHDADVDFSDEAIDFSNNNNNNNKTPNSNIERQIQNESLSCKYCDISFPPVLYSLHMRFHDSDEDPYRCKVCGTQSTDKVSFFVHLATASH